ncbi:hypothetical protein SEVIR_9G518650v4 [Setaria viridis]|uniref:Uncharacterized protein n=1 Tax=Setaria viridis TaxID=4556 RepID=A0A4U6T7K2_SETVI|nr:hypothetical protein SEVIR_9G518650v2 [Setaria viridis]
MDFFGNMVLWAFPWLQVTDLLLNSIELRPSVPRDGEYIQSLVDFGAVADASGEELVAATATAAAAGTIDQPSTHSLDSLMHA